MQARIAGLGSLGEGEVRQRVFVGAVDFGSPRQGLELAERLEHLCGRTFEQSPAACGEQRVAAEQQRRVVAMPVVEIGDMVEGVAGNLEHPEIDAEHLDYYGSLEALERAFGQFLARLPFCGRSVLAGDGLVGERVLADLQRPHQTYGMADDNDYRIAELEERTWGSRFVLCFDGQKLGEIELQVHGVHNVRNAAGAAALTWALPVEFTVIAAALEQFDGADRRFQCKGEFAGVLVVDDYAHHPAELAAALAAARQSGRRVVAVFQPHLYSRTRDLAAAFAGELAAADYVVLAAVYAAREAPLPGVNSALIAEALRASGYKTVAYLPDREQLVAHLVDICRPGDLVLVMGAGDIGEAAAALIAALAAGECA